MNGHFLKVVRNKSKCDIFTCARSRERDDFISLLSMSSKMPLRRSIVGEFINVNAVSTVFLILLVGRLPQSFNVPTSLRFDKSLVTSLLATSDQNLAPARFRDGARFRDHSRENSLSTVTINENLRRQTATARRPIMRTSAQWTSLNQIRSCDDFRLSQTKTQFSVRPNVIGQNSVLPTSDSIF